MATKFISQHRRDTTANWAVSEIVPYEGEIVLEECGSNIVKIKVGDGIHTFSELSYLPVGEHTHSAYATLVDGKVPAAQLPSYMDAICEYTTLANFPSTGETSKVYRDTTTNIIYRWSGSAYVAIPSSIALGETEATAYRGDRGKIAYDHSQVAHAPIDAEANIQSDWNQSDSTADDYIKNKPTILPGNGSVYVGTTTPTDDGINVWVDPSGNCDAVVKYVAQTLTTEQQAQARANIGAISVNGEISFNSPNFTGVPTAPTANVLNNSTQIATTAWVRNYIASLDGDEVTY